MQFKSLTIHGFKSFADKTILDFPDGITAIVGPNGSGKSNIMDSLRWVFGEQRASELRGSDMEDVIFAGSANRKPSGFAQVSLGMDNVSPELAAKWGTMSEVSISRKIYRTGEREYYINGRRCRLKDIKELFLDTGIGARSISIIEQERVTKIVNSSPEELRYFLEETAGISRYKERRKDAESRLRQTMENLGRVKDILALLEIDMQKLREQVSKVNTYREFRAKKEGLQKSAIALLYAKLVKDRAQLEIAIEASRQKAENLIARHQAGLQYELTLQKEIENLRDLIKELRISYDDAKEKHAELGAEISRIETTLESSEKQKKQIQEDKEAAVQNISQMRASMDVLVEGLEENRELYDDFADKLDFCKSNIDEYKLALSEINDEIKAANTKHFKLVQTLTESRNKVSMKNSEIASSKSRTNRLYAEKNAIAAELDAVLARMLSTEEESSDGQDYIDELKAGLQTLHTALTSEKEEYSRVNNLTRQLETKSNTLANQEEFLRHELEASFVGGKGGQELLNAYSGRLYVDINTSETAYIFYNDLFVFADKYKEDALQKAKELDFSFRFIFESDLEHIESLAEADVMDGGVFRHGVIYKKAAADDAGRAHMELEKRLYNVSEEIKTVENELSVNLQYEAECLKKIEKSEAAILVRAAEIKQAEIAFAALQSTKEHIQAEIKRLERNMSVLVKEETLISEMLDKSEEELAMLEADVEKLEITLENQTEERSMLDDKLDNITSLLEDAREEYSHISSEHIKYSERVSALEKEAGTLSANIDKQEKNLQNLENRLLNLPDANSEEWIKRKEAAYKGREEAQKNIILLSDELSRNDINLSEKEKALTEVRKNLTGLNEELREYDKTLATTSSRLESATANMDSLAVQMWESFAEILSDSYEKYATGDLGKVNAGIAEVDRQIEVLGPLNMAAEEEYLTKTEHYDEQKKQMEDIEKSINNLNELITEIDESTVQLFEITFNAVRKNFIDVFNRFFGSGSADLILTDPENMLITGIELKVNPPGKKVSNKNLLSGGEKALAALTLLFALFLQKPTPFCFLDEVDAPLDDANAGRFIGMVKLLSEHTQFIVITHKHQTMAAADSLYGVTMQEGGVSTILSVKLHDVN